VNSTTISIIVGMMLVTYIPRVLPGLLSDHYRLPKAVERWLQNIPYAALGALIFPGIIQGDTPIVGVVGGLTAVILSLMEWHLVLVMAASILAALFTSWFM